MKDLFRQDIAIAIFAVNTDKGKAQEWDYIEKALGFPCHQVVGSYKGRQEYSYVVPWSATTKKAVLKVANSHNQESILIVDRPKNKKRTANLLFLGSMKTEGLGEFKRVSLDVAMTKDGWTQDGGNFYICEG